MRKSWFYFFEKYTLPVTMRKVGETQWNELGNWNTSILSLAGYAIFSKPLKLLETQFLHLLNGNTRRAFSQAAERRTKPGTDSWRELPWPQVTVYWQLWSFPNKRSWQKKKKEAGFREGTMGDGNRIPQRYCVWELKLRTDLSRAEISPSPKKVGCTVAPGR